MENKYINQQKQLVKDLEKSFALKNDSTTIVDVQNDYANDDQMCLTSLVFVPEDISKKIIIDVINPLKTVEPNHYFYPIESMHCTVKNIRIIHKPPLFNQLDIKKVDGLFRKIISQFPSFDFYVEDVVLFPTSISIIVYSNNIFQKLVLALDSGLKKIGVPDDKKYFSDTVFFSNLTVCRFTKQPGKKFIAVVKKMRNLKIGKFKAEKINLVTSNAVSHPKSRKIIAEYKLSNLRNRVT